MMKFLPVLRIIFLLVSVLQMSVAAAKGRGTQTFYGLASCKEVLTRQNLRQLHGVEFKRDLTSNINLEQLSQSSGFEEISVYNGFEFAGSRFYFFETEPDDKGYSKIIVKDANKHLAHYVVLAKAWKVLGANFYFNEKSSQLIVRLTGHRQHQSPNPWSRNGEQPYSYWTSYPQEFELFNLQRK